MGNLAISVEFALKLDVGVKLSRAEFPATASLADGLDYFCNATGFDCNELLGQGFSAAIFGKKRPLDTLLQSGDRIELCGPLIATPMLARRLRAKREHKGGKM